MTTGMYDTIAHVKSMCGWFSGKSIDRRATYLWIVSNRVLHPSDTHRSERRAAALLRRGARTSHRGKWHGCCNLSALPGFAQDCRVYTTVRRYCGASVTGAGVWPFGVVEQDLQVVTWPLGEGWG